MASSPIIDQWNEQWRNSPLYQQGLQAVGEPIGGPPSLDDRQRKALQQWLMQQGVQFPKGAEIDPAGNMNENEGFGKQLKRWGPIVGAGALAAFGIPGLMPGLIGGGAGGGAATATGATQFGGANSAGLFGSGVSAGTNSALGTAGSGLFGAGTGAGAGAGMGIGSSLLGGLKGIGKQLGGDLAQRFLGGAGAGIGAASSAAAHNRGVGLDAEMQAALLREQQRNNYENQILGRAQEDRDSLTDAFTKSVQANRVANTTGYKPASLNMVPGQGPSTLPNFGTGFSAPTAQMRSDAQSLYNQVQPRLTQGSQLPQLQAPQPYQNDPNLMKPGAGERIGSWLGPALTVAGAYRNPLTQREK